MSERILAICYILIMLFTMSPASWAKPELTFFMGQKDGSEASDGVTVRIIIEEDEDDEGTIAFEEHWKGQMWSDQVVVDLSKWAGDTVTLNITTDPGEARNTGWDWILIAEAKIVDGGNVIYDISKAVASGKPKLSMMLDGDKNETDGLGFGANCAIDNGTCGGENKPGSFMQHPAWDGRVGNTISRYEITMGAAVDSKDKLTSTWGNIKTLNIQY